MRKFVICLAAAGTALAVATPASAQYYPAPPPAPSYGNSYGAPYGNAYAYGRNNFGQVRALQVRIDNVQRQIRRLDRQDRIGDRQADSLRREANNIENRLRRSARYGMNGYEANDINVRVARLEQRVQYSLQQRFGRNWNSGWSDRDRDGRNDRFEDDRGYHHD